MIVALIGIGVGVVGVVFAAVALFSVYRLRRSYDLLSVHEGRESMVDVIARTREEIADLSDEVVATQRELQATRRDLAAALRHVAVVRYDAFGDMGGRFSFSAALLDDAGDGLMITSIHGRTETRTYLKGVRAGSSDIDLSPEEQQAIATARGDLPRAREVQGGAA
ncbi:MAG: DUF4446 family protein [Actinobacteria bacterium]|nr:DUF4446 family protein [Actinomycetota bacterium]